MILDENESCKFTLNIPSIVFFKNSFAKKKKKNALSYKPVIWLAEYFHDTY